MDRSDPDRLSREAAEALLSGHLAATPDANGAAGFAGDATPAAAVADLLARARGPAWLDEHAGEEAAVAAFRAARDAPATARSGPTPDRQARSRPVLGRLVPAKVLAVALATTAGGVVLVAATAPGDWLPGGPDPTTPSVVPSQPGSVAPAPAPTRSPTRSSPAPVDRHRDRSSTCAAPTSPCPPTGPPGRCAARSTRRWCGRPATSRCGRTARRRSAPVRPDRRPSRPRRSGPRPLPRPRWRTSSPRC
ncbi:hypothetical protein [Micromonospora zhanjiangensis]